MDKDVTMRPPTRRQFVGTGMASAAVLSLLAGVLVAGASPDLPVHGPHGVGESPPIDGGRAGGSIDRFEVTLDSAAVMAATIVPDGETVAEHGPIAPGRVSEGAGQAPEDPARVAVPPGAPTPDEVARALASIDDRVESVTHVIDDIYQVAGQDLDVEQVRAIAGVLAAEVEGISYPTGDPHLPVQWGLENTGRTFGGITGTPGLDIGFTEASQIATGSGVVVAVVDSGIQTDHPDLSGRFWRNPGEICDNGVDDDRNGFVDDCRGWDFVHQDATVYDPQGDNAHGTHVAGIVAATTDNGVGVASLAPGATIMPVKVFDGGSAPVTRIAAAIEYAVANGADVINLSLGGDASRSLERALDAAAAADVLVVAAAGNESRDIDTQPTYPASYPHANLVSVGSHAADGRVSSFSNTGAVSVDVFAPGEMIAATYPGSGYSYMSGTSMAAPMVSAMAATIAQHRATTSAAALHPAILDAVVTDGAYQGRSVTGGRVFAPLALGDVPVESGGVIASFAGLADLQPGTVSSTITAGLGDAVTEGVDLELLLARWYDDAPHAVIGHDMTVAVDGASRATATDAEGRLVLELTDTTRSSLAEGSLRIDVATDLPAGQYALAVLPVPDDGTARRPAAAFFVVGDPTPVPEEPPTDDPAPGDGTSPSPDDGTAPAPEPDAGAPPPGGGTGPDPTGPGTPEPAPGTAPDPHSPPPPPATDDDPGTSPDPGAGTSPDPGAGTPPPPSGGTSPDPGTAPPPGGGTAPDPDAGTAPPPGGTTAPDPDDGGSPGPGAGDEPTEPAPPVWPTSGPSDGGTWVSVKGSFDPFGTYYVHIGDQILRPVVMMSSLLQVVTTASAAQGPQDVVVLGPGGVEVVRYPAAYTFVQDGDAPPPPGDSTSPPPDDGSAPPPDDGSAPPPNDGSAPAPDGDAPARTPMTAGSPFTLPDGLALDRIVSGPLAGLTADAWISTQCVSSPCDGVRVG